MVNRWKAYPFSCFLVRIIGVKTLALCEDCIQIVSLIFRCHDDLLSSKVFPHNHSNDCTAVVTCGCTSGMLEFLYRPQEDVSYDFIASMYAIGAMIAIILAGLDMGLHLEEVKGFWIIFAPFTVCLIWALVMRNLSRSKINQTKKDD
jgi:hypothetical protein